MSEEMDDKCVISADFVSTECFNCVTLIVAAVFLLFSFPWSPHFQKGSAQASHSYNLGFSLHAEKCSFLTNNFWGS